MKKEVSTLESSLQEAPPKEMFYVLEKSSGTFSNCYFRKRLLERYSIIPNANQLKIVEEEIEIFRKKQTGVFFISGPCGKGKSMTAVFLAKALNAMYCEDCEPWEPGDSIQSLYMDFHDLMVKDNKPLVIVFDEIDVKLEAIHFGRIPNNVNVQTSVRDKCGWNKLFSKIERGLFPNLIIVMTSNKSPEQITKIMDNDTSYLRKGRVDRFFSLV